MMVKLCRRWLIGHPDLARGLILTTAVLVGTLSYFLAYRSIEQDYWEVHRIQTRIEASHLEMEFLHGPAIGIGALLGLSEPMVKALVQGQRPADDPAVLERLRAARLHLKADGIYVIDGKGDIVAHETEKARSTGTNVAFRPYWKQAISGQENVYPAVGSISKERGLFIASPIYAGTDKTTSVIGTVVIKMLAEAVEEELNRPKREALLLSPQGVVFAATNHAWLFNLKQPKSIEELLRIRELRQFGAALDQNNHPTVLPFDTRAKFVSIDGHRYAVASHNVRWNDPEGDWTLMLFSNNQALASTWQRAALFGLLVGGLALAFLAVLLREQREEVGRQDEVQKTQITAAELAEALHLKAWQSDFTFTLQQARDLPTLAAVLFRQLAGVLPLHQASLYVVEEGQEDRQQLMLAGSYGSTTSAPATIKFGEGLVGQSALDRRILSFSDVPAGFWNISSGLGEGKPHALLLIPIQRSEQLLGILEIASLNTVLQDGQSIVENLLPILAMNLDVLLAERQTKRTLQKANELAEDYRIQHERAQEIEAWYSAVLHGAPDAIIVADSSGAMVLTNRVAQNMFGYSDEEMQGMKIEQLLPESLHQNHVQYRESFMQLAIEGEQPKRMASWRSGLTALRKDGSPLSVTISLSILPYTAKYGRCVCAIIRSA